MAKIKDTIESFKAIQEKLTDLIELTADDKQLEARIKEEDEEYWYFQNVFALDLGHFQHSNSK